MWKIIHCTNGLFTIDEDKLLSAIVKKTRWNKSYFAGKRMVYVTQIKVVTLKSHAAGLHFLD
ncbi:MAG: hypothetical protein ACLS28_23255 [Clostridium neonatale]